MGFLSLISHLQCSAHNSLSCFPVFSIFFPATLRDLVAGCCTAARDGNNTDSKVAGLALSNFVAGWHEKNPSRACLVSSKAVRHKDGGTVGMRIAVVAVANPYVVDMRVLRVVRLFV